LPPAIPARRLFQLPDFYNPNPGVFPLPAVAPPAPPATLSPPPNPPVPGTSSLQGVVATASNSSETGDPYLNNQIPIIPTGVTVPIPAPGALHPFKPLISTFGVAGTTYSSIVSNSVVNLYWPGANAATLLETTGLGTTAVNVPLPNGVGAPY